MIRFLSALSVLFVLSVPAYAGYTVHVDQQRQEFTTVSGPAGPQPWRASSEAPAAPPTYGAELCRPDNYSVFAGDASRRTRVFGDNYGVATLSDILAACPQFRTGLIDSARSRVAAELAKTDYKVIKQAEGVYTMTPEEKAARQALRDRFSAYESSVNAATTIEELLGISWN